MAPKTRKTKEIVAQSNPNIPVTYFSDVVLLCKQNNIKYFKSAELELHFGEDIKLPETPVATEKADKENFKEQVLGDLLLENPLAYEEALNRE